MELDGLMKSHIRDGAAVVQYLVWLDKQVCLWILCMVYFLDEDNHIFLSSLFFAYFSSVMFQNMLQVLRCQIMMQKLGSICRCRIFMGHLVTFWRGIL